MTIKQILEEAISILKQNNIEEPILKSKLLLAFVLKQEKEYLLINDNKELLEMEENEYREIINMLIEGEPIQYIIGKQEFMGLDFEVNKNVLIPRADTEILVEEIISIIGEKDFKVLDLCTGSGAIAVSLAKKLKNIKVTATDISLEALETAKKNAVLNDVVAKFINSDLFENIKGSFDIIVSNPPYIETDIIKTLSKDVQHEPFIALDGGKDGLDIYRKIVNEAYKYLNENGTLALEIGYNQKEQVINLLRESGNYIDIYSKKDFGGNDRIVIAKKIVKKALKTIG
ncbi:MAG: peptide chain release factor N(5)-glutamine methyltransferase [Clostridia bacterium]|nr:peptide chain release factor N(5)-glutamine methyltransferase [Clostridia bacterium]